MVSALIDYDHNNSDMFIYINTNVYTQPLEHLRIPEDIQHNNMILSRDSNGLIDCGFIVTNQHSWSKLWKNVMDEISFNGIIGRSMSEIMTLCCDSKITKVMSRAAIMNKMFSTRMDNKVCFVLFSNDKHHYNVDITNIKHHIIIVDDNIHVYHHKDTVDTVQTEKHTEARTVSSILSQSKSRSLVYLFIDVSVLPHITQEIDTKMSWYNDNKITLFLSSTANSVDSRLMVTSPYAWLNTTSVLKHRGMITNGECMFLNSNNDKINDVFMSDKSLWNVRASIKVSMDAIFHNKTPCSMSRHYLINI